ncbi:hypothetical protein [Mixta calida]|uniref:hypothetical protein n=1 Tax=Mixta calida TaxID=665913 RepID=UPI0029114025|nr:hypothetical protein [Mixta calida]MDU4288641.1 hypothetical protein [Mixta calida]
MKIQFIDESGSLVVWDNVPEDKLQSLLNVRACAKHFGINENTALARVHRDWPVLLALATEEPKQ